MEITFLSHGRASSAHGVFGARVFPNTISFFPSTWPDLPNQPTLHMFCMVNVSERFLKCPFHSF